MHRKNNVKHDKRKPIYENGGKNDNNKLSLSHIYSYINFAIILVVLRNNFKLL
jgi:hypothetical protein